ncbi:MAG: hypothetical protein ACO3E9_03140 [Gemmataceae bacterium]
MTAPLLHPGSDGGKNLLVIGEAVCIPLAEDLLAINLDIKNAARTPLLLNTNLVAILARNCSRQTGGKITVASGSAISNFHIHGTTPYFLVASRSRAYRATMISSLVGMIQT